MKEGTKIKYKVIDSTEYKEGVILGSYLTDQTNEWGGRTQGAHGLSTTITIFIVKVGDGIEHIGGSQISNVLD